MESRCRDGKKPLVLFSKKLHNLASHKSRSSIQTSLAHFRVTRGKPRSIRAQYVAQNLHRLVAQVRFLRVNSAKRWTRYWFTLIGCSRLMADEACLFRGVILHGCFGKYCCSSCRIGSRPGPSRSCAETCDDHNARHRSGRIGILERPAEIGVT